MERFRRLRNNSIARQMIRETSLSLDDLIYPLFAVEGEGIKEEIGALPEVYHFSIDELVKEVKDCLKKGVNKFLIFGVPAYKDSLGSAAYDQDGIVQRAVKAIKTECPEAYVITDVCLCAYTDHGHCGCLGSNGLIENDATLALLDRIAVSHAKAGADMVAPSDMMDGRIGSMRDALDEAGFEYTPIMAYSAKYCSSYYGPFREAAHSAPQFGDRKTYQMDYHNKNEAVNAVFADLDGGADMVMVKPALAYLDIIRTIKDKVTVPVVAYNVSGEYSMLKNAVKMGLMNESVIYETMISFKRAGSDIIITYFAKYIAEQMLEGKWGK